MITSPSSRCEHSEAISILSLPSEMDLRCARNDGTNRSPDMPARQNWFEGWRLFAVLALTLLALSVWIAGMRQFEVEGVRMVIRFTARSSLLLFCIAFGAAALARLWPNAWTRWQRRNRRYLGLSFAASHAIHAAAIVVFANIDPA